MVATIEALLNRVVTHRQTATYKALNLALPHRGHWLDMRYRWSMVDRPHYAFGLGNAAQLSAALGLSGFTAIELGVAGGNGLVQLEAHAEYYASRFDLRIDVVGFDAGTGLPAPVDYRDVPYKWNAEFYKMDVDKLRASLKNSTTLIIGDVAETIPRYHPVLPIGFIAFDLDYYSSTAAALGLLEGDDFARWLPRIAAYFDDLETIAWIGEHLAIAEWNSKSDDRKIGQVTGVRNLIPGFAEWADWMFEVHLFRHPLYTRQLIANDQLPLRVRRPNY